MPRAGNPAKVSATGERPGFGEQRAPFARVGNRERGPFAKGAAGGREGQGLAGSNQLVHPGGGELNVEVPSCSLHSGEEGAVGA